MTFPPRPRHLERAEEFLEALATVRPVRSTPPWATEDPRRFVRAGLLAMGAPVREVLSPDGKVVLTEQGHDLAVRDLATDGLRLLTDDGTETSPWAIAGVDDFARSTIGGEPSSSATWSPDGRLVAVHRLDFGGVSQVPVVDWLDAEQPVDLVRYTKAGGKLPATQTWIANIDSGDRTLVDVGPPDLAVRTFIGPWTAPGGDQRLYLYTLDRACRTLRLLEVDPTTGSSHVVVEEHSPTFHQAVRWLQLPGEIATFTDSGDQFVWISDRDRFSHLYVMDRGGTVQRQLTHGHWDVEQVVGIDPTDQSVVFLSHDDPDRPGDIRLQRVPLEGGASPSLITTEPGVRHLQPSPDWQQFFVVQSGLTRPQRALLLDRHGAQVDCLDEADLGHLATLDLPSPERFTAVAADGETLLHGLLFHPPDFDPSMSWPLVEQIYGGPNLAYVPQDHLAIMASPARMISQLGYVTFVVDGRGTAGRGRDFHEASYGKIGATVVADHAAVTRQLLDRHDHLDPERVGIFGASFGGYMTIRALLDAPDVYRAGASSVPVTDFEDVRAGAIEPYMGLREDNEAGYDDADLPARAAALRRPLLLTANTSDVNATFSAAMRLVNALVDAVVPHQLVVFPGSDHAMSPDRRRYWLRTLAAFFEQHLGPS